MIYQVVFRPEAWAEAGDAADYIAMHGSHEQAENWFAEIDAAVQSLSVMPRRCAFAREQFAYPGVELRQLEIHSYRLIFRIHGDEVHVLRVRHAAQANVSDLQGFNPAAED